MNKILCLGLASAVFLSLSSAKAAETVMTPSSLTPEARVGLARILSECIGAAPSNPDRQIPQAYTSMLSKIGHIAQSETNAMGSLDAVLAGYESTQDWLRRSPGTAQNFGIHSKYPDCVKNPMPKTWRGILARTNNLAKKKFTDLATFEALMRGQGDAVSWFKADRNAFVAWAAEAFPELVPAFRDFEITYEWTAKTLTEEGKQEFSILVNRVGSVVVERFQAQATLMVLDQRSYQTAADMFRRQPGGFLNWARGLEVIKKNGLEVVFQTSALTYEALLTQLARTAAGDFHAKVSGYAQTRGITSPQKLFETDPSGTLLWMNQSFPYYGKAFLPLWD